MLKNNKFIILILFLVIFQFVFKQDTFAIGQFTPTGGQLVVGAERTIDANGATAGNIGSWKGTLNDDAYRWDVDVNSSTGLDQQVFLDNVDSNNANKLIIKMIVKSNYSTHPRYYQICDFVNSTDTVADTSGNCSGGWRTLNKTDGSIRRYIDETNERTLTYHIYDGYWNSGTVGTSNTPVSTPITNFINANKRMIIRAYSATGLIATTHYFDLVSVQTVIDPVYHPAGYGKNSGGDATTSYINAQNPPTLISGDGAATGSDNVDFSIPGTDSEIADFYFKFQNIKTLPAFNTIVMAGEYSCGASGQNIIPQIYNFKTGFFEDLSSATTACPTSDTVYRFAKNNIVIEDYVQNGEARIGLRDSSAATTTITVDYMYIMVGMTNKDSSSEYCRLEFGTGVASDCTKTRSLDTTNIDPWSITTELEADGRADYVPYGNDADNVVNEAIATPHVRISNIIPNNVSLVGFAYALYFRSNATTVTLYPQMKDESGGNTVTMGGYTNFATSNATTTYTYTDSIITNYFASNPTDYVDRRDQVSTIRFRTSASTLVGSNVSPDIDFIFLSVQYIQKARDYPSLNAQFIGTGGQLVSGTEIPTQLRAQGSAGSYKGTMNDDVFYWQVNQDTSNGLNQQVQIDDVRLNNANTLIITTIASASAATLNRYYQICDWKNPNFVNNVADTECTGGGWRTLNKTNGTARAAIAETTQRTYRWFIYNGYWTTSDTGNTPVNTPLANFVEPGVNRVLIRTYAPASVAAIHYWDYIAVQPVIDSYYYPSGYLKIRGGSVAGSYINAENPPTQVSGTNANGSDGYYVGLPGTSELPSESYMVFDDVRKYEGINTIAAGIEFDCTNTGPSVQTKLYNFTSDQWVNIGSAYACSTTDTIHYIALNNININEYVSKNKQVWLGFFGDINSTVTIRFDFAFIALGTTVSSASDCDLSLGTSGSGSCTDTATLDTIGATTPWVIANEADAATRATDFYPYDGDIDAVVNEYTAAVNANFSVKVPEHGSIAGHGYFLRYRANTTSQRVYYQFRDYSGLNTSTMGGWTNGSTYNASATYSVFNAPTNFYFQQNPNDYVNYATNTINMRIRTERSTVTSANNWDVDFLMVCPQWIESGGSSDPLDSQEMRHGNWFSDYGIEKVFSF